LAGRVGEDAEEFESWRGQQRMPADYRFAFLVEWLDPQAQLVRQYLLFFYSIDGTVEMDDIKNRRKFLRR